MRATLSLLPAVLITLALFYLMDFMISGRTQDLKPVHEYGVVDFVRLQPEPEETVIARSRRSLPERIEALAGSPSPPSLAVAPQLKPAQPELAAEMPSLGKVALGELPPLSSLNVSIPKPRVERAPQVPLSPPAHIPTSADIASQPVSPGALGDTPGGLGAPAGGLDGDQIAVPGLGGAADGEVVALFRLEPDYPRKAAIAGTEGWVKVVFTINERGTVTDAVVVDSKPSRVFDRSALRAIRKWRFKPMVANGETVARRATQVFEFKLAGN